VPALPLALVGAALVTAKRDQHRGCPRGVTTNDAKPAARAPDEAVAAASGGWA
jgi:hypothetical protein